MGICINLNISKTVTREEWSKVYKESLKMINSFPLADRREVNINGFNTICLVRTKEREDIYGWNNKKTDVGWFAEGDYESARTAEVYYLPRDLVDDNEYKIECEDAMFSMGKEYLDYDWHDERFHNSYQLWGNKTQGEPYHMYLLAIACMIETRLGKKAFFDGDITRGQCIEAVRIANEVLETPVEIPDRCSVAKLGERVNAMPFREAEKIRMFVGLYLGNKDKEFGEQVRSLFSTEAWDMYWAKRFSYYSVDLRGFGLAFKDYLLWGFDIEQLCKYVKFENKDGVLLYESFVKHVMDAKLHVEDKDCSDPLKIDQDDSVPYTVSTYFAQLAFMGAENRKIDRYIPLEEIRKALVSGIGDKCDVYGIIDKYIQEEAGKKGNDVSVASQGKDDDISGLDQSDIFKEYMDIKRSQLKKLYETYDIVMCEDLEYFETGNTLSPDIKEALGKVFSFYQNTLDEGKYKELMKGGFQKKCMFLTEQNRHFLLRDKDWKKVFQNIREDEGSYARYYPMVRIQADTEVVMYIIKGIVLNDELYSYCCETETCPT